MMGGNEEFGDMAARAGAASGTDAAQTGATQLKQSQRA